MLLGAKCKDVRIWDPVAVKFEKRLIRWKRSLLSIKGASNSYQKHIGQFCYLLCALSINIE